LANLHLIDGGLSTELTRIGAAFEGELWTGRALLNDPSLVEQAHRNYAQAGAEIVISSSYQLSRIGFEEIGLSGSSADQALTKSIEVARAAVEGTSTKVAASVGPYGAVLHDGSEYRGDYKVSQNFLEDFHAERIDVLIAAQPDFLSVETIPNVIEARALSNVLKQVSIPAWVSFTAESTEKLWSGEYVEEAVEAVAELQHLVAIGVNCVSPELVSGLISRIKSVSGADAIAYPNRGGQWDAKQGIWLNEVPREFTSWLPEWIDAGVNWLGGCCGTDATDIHSLKKALS
jgi:homocysteine S-methyltransferase